MGINLTPPKLKDMKPRITVMGVGGAGGNAINNMITSGLEGVEFIAANTDIQALLTSSAEQRIQLGANVTEGLGAGAKPEIGEAAAEEAIDEIRAQISGSHMVFIACGMGGGTGTGAASVIARVAQEEGILTVGIVTKPFQFEGSRRMRIANAGIEEMKKFVDTMIVIPNQNLFRITNEKTTFAEAFVLADQVLYSGIACIVDLIVKEGLINLDFADVRVIMKGMGSAMMGTGEGEGERRAVIAAEEAISNPLLDELTLEGARGLLVSIVGSSDLTLYEIEEAASRVHQEVHPDANIMVGASFDESLKDRIRVSIVASGMDLALGEETSPAQGKQGAPAQGANVPPQPPQMPEQSSPQDHSHPQGQGQAQTSGQAQSLNQNQGQSLSGALQASEPSRTAAPQKGQSQPDNTGRDPNAQLGGQNQLIPNSSAHNAGAATPAKGMSDGQHVTIAATAQSSPAPTSTQSSSVPPAANALAPQPQAMAPPAIPAPALAQGSAFQGSTFQTASASSPAAITAPPAAQHVSPAAAKGAAWLAPGNVMIEEAPPQLSQGAQQGDTPAAPISGQSTTASTPQAAAQFAPAAPQSLGVAPRKMPAVEDFPLVGQREYHAKSPAGATASTAAIPDRSTAPTSPAKKPGFFERLTGRRSHEGEPVKSQAGTGAGAEANSAQHNVAQSSQLAGSGPTLSGASDSNHLGPNSTQSSSHDDGRNAKTAELPPFFDQRKR